MSVFWYVVGFLWVLKSDVCVNVCFGFVFLWGVDVCVDVCCGLFFMGIEACCLCSGMLWFVFGG